jgi:hypothetical protein
MRVSAAADCSNIRPHSENGRQCDSWLLEIYTKKPWVLIMLLMFFTKFMYSQGRPLKGCYLPAGAPVGHSCFQEDDKSQEYQPHIKQLQLTCYPNKTGQQK